MNELNLNLNSDEKRLIEQYRGLSREGKQVLMNYVMHGVIKNLEERVKELEKAIFMPTVARDEKPQGTENTPEPIGDFKLFWTEERIRGGVVPDLEKIRGHKLSVEEIKDTMNRYLARDLIHHFRGDNYPVSERMIDNVLQAIRGNA